jgi:hypothetical protein
MQGGIAPLNPLCAVGFEGAGNIGFPVDVFSLYPVYQLKTNYLFN